MLTPRTERKLRTYVTHQASARGADEAGTRVRRGWWWPRRTRWISGDAHDPAGALLLQPRWSMSFMRGPMTRREIRDALYAQRTTHGEQPAVQSTSTELAG